MLTDGARPVVVLVTPVFNEEASLDAYAVEVSEVLLARQDVEYRVLFVDDGSSDRSWAIIEALCAENPRFQGLRLSRNFGSHTALSAGFMEVTDDADAVATLACDLQDPPHTVLSFVERWRSGAQIVWGARRSREDTGWKVAASRAFHALLRRYAMPPGSQFATGSFLLVDRQVLECVRQYKERQRITFALVAWTGFDQDVVEYDRRRRAAGISGWSFGRMISTMYDAFVGFSALPTRLMKMASASAFTLSVLLVAYLAIVAASGSRVPGWTSQMLLLSVFFGVQFSLMAIMGEYLYRIYAESLQRPLFFVSRRTFPAEPPAAQHDVRSVPARPARSA